MTDKLIRGMARDGNIRILMISSKDLVQEAKDLHDTYPTVTAALGRTMNVSLMMAHMLKNENEKLSVEIRGNNELKYLIVNADNTGHVRATLNNPHIFKVKDNGKLDVGGIIGEGTLKVTHSLDNKILYNSVVDLQSGEIGDDFAYYFAQSEQIPSAVSVGVLVGEDLNVISSGGMIIQVLPSASEEDIVAIENIVSNLKPMSTYLKEMSVYELFNELFEDGVILSTSDVAYHCGCNREQMHQVLVTLNTTDLNDLIENDHGATLKCHYCNQEYHFNEEELKDIIKSR